MGIRNPVNATGNSLRKGRKMSTTYKNAKKTKKVTKKKQDKYDKGIKYLLQFDGDKFKEEVLQAWSGVPNPAHCLFQFCTPTGCGMKHPKETKYIGCLTQIKNDTFGTMAWTEELTAEIVNDPNIPTNPWHVTKESLPHFAKYQRKMDRTIRRKKKGE